MTGLDLFIALEHVQMLCCVTYLIQFLHKTKRKNLGEGIETDSSLRRIN